jgi:hypothetical protein
MEIWRIELQTFRMQSGRSTTELYPHILSPPNFKYTNAILEVLASMWSLFRLVYLANPLWLIHYIFYFMYHIVSIDEEQAMIFSFGVCTMTLSREREAGTKRSIPGNTPGITP